MRSAGTAGRCIAFVFALIGTALAIGGCSDTPTAPGLEVSDDFGVSENQGGGTSIARNMHETRPGWTVQQEIGKHREIMFLDGKELKLTFPTKALNQDTMLFAHMRLDAERGSATRVDFDFQPPMSFAKPVELSISSTYLSGDSFTYKLWSIDPVLGGVQKLAEKRIIPGQNVVFTLDHFSTYAISR
jgi:hypothetical protein